MFFHNFVWTEFYEYSLFPLVLYFTRHNKVILRVDVLRHATLASRRPPLTDKEARRRMAVLLLLLLHISAPPFCILGSFSATRNRSKRSTLKCNSRDHEYKVADRVGAAKVRRGDSPWSTPLHHPAILYAFERAELATYEALIHWQPTVPLPSHYK